ncbi:hypothetical protein PszF2a_13510 [Stutzerimonas stutzeri]|nr:hypothetical protein PszF2a_13510 [Stutzerimonas stutzeri]
MSPSSFSDKKVVRLRDTTRNPIHTVVSDSHNLGVANVLEISSPVPARSSAASAVMERQGCLATAALGAPAVRQYGGGRAPRAPLTQPPGGRRARSTGGEIKSLCCAAAGIIALASRPRGARAHPLTGVRRAAHHAAPLRSMTCPHAQSVQGYRCHVQISIATEPRRHGERNVAMKKPAGHLLASKPQLLSHGQSGVDVLARPQFTRTNRLLDAIKPTKGDEKFLGHKQLVTVNNDGERPFFQGRTRRQLVMRHPIGNLSVAADVTTRKRVHVPNLYEACTKSEVYKREGVRYARRVAPYSYGNSVFPCVASPLARVNVNALRLGEAQA